VSYSKLHTFASKSDLTLKYIGWLNACIAGLAIPSFVFLIGNIIDSFNGSINNIDESIRDIGRMAWILTLIGAFVWIVTFVYFSSLMIFSESVIMKTKVEYVKAILK
jgi:hypothetical protein